MTVLAIFMLICTNGVNIAHGAVVGKDTSTAIGTGLGIVGPAGQLAKWGLEKTGVIEKTSMIDNMVAVGKFLIEQILNPLAQAIFNLASLFLSATAFLMNMSINMTLHIKDFVMGIPSIYVLWKTIRDISGILVIFTLLYASFKIILGMEDGALKIIKNAIIGGILINFSFFFVGLMIDASNLISFTIYGSIIPSSELKERCIIAKPQNNESVLQAYQKCEADKFSSGTNGGITAIMTNGLGISNLVDKNFGGTSGITLLFMQIVSIIILIVTALSLLVAAGAFIVRLVILVFLLAVSPIYFASMIFPGMNDLSSKFTKMLTSQLLFMPVYLFLLYIALSIISKMPTSNLASSILSQGKGDNMSIVVAVGAILMHFTIVVLAINAPLLGAASVWSGVGSWKDRFGAGKIFGQVGGFAKKWTMKGVTKGTGAVATRTIGKVGAQLDKKWGNTAWGNSALGRDFRSATVGKMAGAKMGASRSYTEQQKLEREINQKGKEIKRRSDLIEALKTPGNIAGVGAIMKDMSAKEKLALGGDILSNEEIMYHLSNDDHDAIKKAEEGFTEEQKKNIAGGKMKSLNTAIANGTVPDIKKMIENMDGKDLIKLDGNDGRPDITNPAIMKQLKPSQLKHLQEEGWDDKTRRKAIGDFVRSTTDHRSTDYVNNNTAFWS